MKLILEQEYLNHDCHKTAEDGCETCEKWAEQQEYLKGYFHDQNVDRQIAMNRGEYA